MPQKNQYQTRKTLLSGLIILLGFITLLGYDLFASYQEQMLAAQQNADNMARVLERHAIASIEKIDVVLEQVTHEFPPSQRQKYSQTEINTRLSQLLQAIPESQSLRIMDAEGHLIYDATGRSSNINIRDRKYFQRHRDNPEAGLVISEPIFARLTSNWVITLSRRFNTPDGSFAGLVQAAMNTNYFENFYQTLSLRRGMVGLYDDSLRLISRHPEVKEALGQPLNSPLFAAAIATETRSGNYLTLSNIDQVERQYVYRRLEKYPLVVLVGSATSEILQSWQHKLWLYVGAVILLASSLLLMLYQAQQNYVDALKLAERIRTEMEESSSRFRTLLDSMIDMAWIRDCNARFHAVNAAYARMVKRPVDALIGKTLFDIWPQHKATQFHTDDLKVLESGNPCRGEVILDDPELGPRSYEYIRTPVRDAAGTIVGIAGIARDITDWRETEARIQHISETDRLTGLPNRQTLQIKLSSWLANPSANDVSLAIMCLDLDNFKTINDSLGHEVGDGLLRKVADRLRSCLQEQDILSRQGGDEFTIVLVNYPDSTAIARAASQLLHTLAHTFYVDEHELSLSASIGISVYPENGTDVSTLLRNADTAMYSAKSNGRNRFHFFTAEMNAHIQERLRLEKMLRKALERNELCVHYQPQFAALTGELIGVEALLRWNQPELGMISPVRFIPLAEETGLILPIGAWVLREACQQQVAWIKQGLPPLRMAVNLSVVQFRQEDLLALVAAVINETGIDPDCLELEITESLLIENDQRSVCILDQLKDLGVHIAIDDFGTGYSSLSYLKRFPLDKIKIDRSFVRDIHTDGSDAAIVQAIIAIAAKLGFGVIAEGVETAEQLHYLSQNGCKEIQGFYFSPAVEPHEVPEFLKPDWKPAALR